MSHSPFASAGTPCPESPEAVPGTDGGRALLPGPLKRLLLYYNPLHVLLLETHGLSRSHVLTVTLCDSSWRLCQKLYPLPKRRCGFWLFPSSHFPVTCQCLVLSEPSRKKSQEGGLQASSPVPYRSEHRRSKYRWEQMCKWPRPTAKVMVNLQPPFPDINQSSKVLYIVFCYFSSAHLERKYISILLVISVKF